MYPYLNTHFNEPTTYTLSNQEIRQFDKRPLWRKVIDCVLSILREYAYSLSMFWNRMTISPKHYHNCDQNIEWNKSSHGLFVLIHGLNGHPSSWNSHIKEIKKEKNVDIFTPFVPEKGQCTLEKAANPILKHVQAYCDKHPNKPVILIGVSNGGRIATYIDIEMRKKDKYHKTAIKVSTIAAVHFGSLAIDHLKNFGLDGLILQEHVSKELVHGSQKARELLHELKKPLPTGVTRHYEFYATTEDSRVGLPSSLPKLNHNEKLHVIHGHGHNSIVKAIHKHQVAAGMTLIKPQG